MMELFLEFARLCLFALSFLWIVGLVIMAIGLISKVSYRGKNIKWLVVVLGIDIMVFAWLGVSSVDDYVDQIRTNNAYSIDFKNQKELFVFR